MDVIGEFEESHEVTDICAAHAELSGEIFDGAAEALEVIAEGGCFFEDVEIFAFEIFFEGRFGGLLVIEFDDAAGDGIESDLLCGAPASFTGDEEETAFGARPNEEWLEDAVSAEAFGEFVDGGLFEFAAWLEGISFDEIEGDFVSGGCWRSGVLVHGEDGGLFGSIGFVISEQRAESSSESAFEEGL